MVEKLCKCGCGGIPNPGRDYINGHNRKGVPMTDEHKKNISIGNTGKNHGLIGYQHTDEAKRSMSESKMGHKVSDISRIKMSEAWTDDRRSKTSERMLGKYTGTNNPNWKGGISPDRSMWQIRGGNEWRISIFERDDFTCQECGSRGGDLNAHHILPYRDWKDKQYSLNLMNGITLCVDCHRETFNNEYEYFNKYFDIVNGVM